MQKPFDCLIIGGGPAGLTAAIYLARFHLSVRLFDAGESRARSIAQTRNHAGFPGGISGIDLLDRMREQAGEFGVQVIAATVDRLERDHDLFRLRASSREWTARTVLLATGVVNNRPPMSSKLHATALHRGLLRYCPICDGYEVTDKRIAVIGTKSRGYDEAVFLRMYTRDVVLIAADGPHDLQPCEREKLSELGIEVIDGPCQPLILRDDRIVVSIPSGERAFASVYPALGSVIRSELAVGLGADATGDACLIVDDHQRTSVSGLYAAGDVAKGLDQISHAMGQASVAATTIRNDLAEIAPFVR